MTTNNASRSIAKYRLKNVIYNDRIKKILDDKTLDLIKYDIFKAVAKYINLSENNIKISLSDENIKQSTMLNINICIDDLVNCLRKE